MEFTLRKILADRAHQYAQRRGFTTEAERIAIVDGWFAGWKSARRLDERVDRLLEEGAAANDG